MEISESYENVHAVAIMAAILAASGDNHLETCADRAHQLYGYVAAQAIAAAEGE